MRTKTGQQCMYYLQANFRLGHLLLYVHNPHIYFFVYIVVHIRFFIFISWVKLNVFW